MNGHLGRLIALAVVTAVCCSSPSVVFAQAACPPDQWARVPGLPATNGTAVSAVNFSNRLHLFFVAGSDIVQEAVFSAKGGSGWKGGRDNPSDNLQSIRAGGHGPTAVVVDDEHELDLFVVDSTGRIFVNIARSGFEFNGLPDRFEGWTEVPGRFLDFGRNILEPGGFRSTHEVSGAPLLNGPSRLALFARAADGSIWINTQSLNREWTGWDLVPGGGTTTDAPSVVEFGNLYLYVRGTDTAPWQNIFDFTTGTGKWLGWERVSNTSITAAPTAPRYLGSDSGLLVTRGHGGGIFIQTVKNGIPQDVPGQLAVTAAAAPAWATDLDEATLLLFISGPGDRLFCNALTTLP